jgi:hypothetical protein
MSLPTNLNTMIPNLATRNPTVADMVATRLHSIAEIDADADANIKRHRQDLDVGPACVIVVRVHGAGFEDASVCYHAGIVVALGSEAELHSQDVAILVAAALRDFVAVAAACVVSPGDADETEGGDREGRDRDVTDFARNWVVDRVEVDV